LSLTSCPSRSRSREAPPMPPDSTARPPEPFCPCSSAPLLLTSFSADIPSRAPLILGFAASSQFLVFLAFSPSRPVIGQVIFPLISELPIVGYGVGTPLRRHRFNCFVPPSRYILRGPFFGCGPGSSGHLGVCSPSSAEPTPILLI